MWVEPSVKRYGRLHGVRDGDGQGNGDVASRFGNKQPMSAILSCDLRLVVFFGAPRPQFPTIVGSLQPVRVLAIRKTRR
jgi:hypothetical protein